MALASDGSLFTWGGGKYGQLGHSSLHAVNVMIPEQPIVLATPHKIAALEPGLLKPWSRVTSIAAGKNKSLSASTSHLLLSSRKHSMEEQLIAHACALYAA
jgi:alpha-tubulin suppressor-like RCC1 family protein